MGSLRPTEHLEDEPVQLLPVRRKLPPTEALYAELMEVVSDGPAFRPDTRDLHSIYRLSLPLFKTPATRLPGRNRGLITGVDGSVISDGARSPCPSRA